MVGGVAATLPIMCPHCGRPVAEIVNPSGTLRATGGVVTEIPGRDGGLRQYQASCSARRKHFEMRRWTPATLARAWHAYHGIRPQITMSDIRRNLPEPPPRLPAPNPAQGRGAFWAPGAR